MIISLTTSLALYFANPYAKLDGLLYCTLLLNGYDVIFILFLAVLRLQLHMFVENNMDLQQSQRYARQLCEHTDNKRLCGQILHRFTSTMLPAEAASYMYDIVTLDFFQDIRGAMKELMEEIPRAREDLEGLLDESHQRDKDGEILDSDADSDGNLR